MNRVLQVLMVEDSAEDARLIERALRTGGIEASVRRVQAREEFLHALEDQPAIILVDYRLPGFDGRLAIKLARERLPDTPTIIVTGTLPDETAVEVLREGAVDYILKDRLSRLAPAVRRALDEAAQQAAARRAEAALRASEQRFRMLAELAPVGIFCSDEAGDFTYVNERWCGMTGLMPDQAQGRGWINGLYMQDRGPIADAWYRSSKSGGPFQEEYRLSDGQGHMTWVLARAVAQKNAQGEVTGYLGTVTDISAHKEAERKLREQLDELRRFQAATVDRELRMEELQEELRRLKAMHPVP